MDTDNGDNGSGQWPATLDAVTAAPNHHAVLLENETVRVLDTRIGPGDRTPVHIHQWPSVLCILSWSDFVRYDADGRVLVDSRAFAAAAEPGTTHWSDALGSHSVENVGNQVLHVIAVELKTPRA